MNGVHDMGGMHGFGSIPIEDDEPVFHHEWEGRIFGIPTPPIPGGFRYAIERLDPAFYLTSSYYEKWLWVRLQTHLDSGSFTQAEFDEYLNYFRENPQAVPPKRENQEALPSAITWIKSSQSNQIASEIKPAFEIGTTIITRNIHPSGHTRLPRYARGKRGQVVNYYGVQLFDDATSVGRSDEAEPLYNVRFEGGELWGESAEPNSAVYLDMWESYLDLYNPNDF